ncbi:hypothetical protein KIM372_09350 [Bombiscardovia nodaiensis]|uniref:DUF1648 domain-containing protein n=1 Tax=Bombiscardovia nodaiensis TaxID=2932181 RepID=A0ABM8B832_9BIFI|nr:hypothetical protein KIM372_09350 [Bombiscardovia nodaiensis]
MAIWLLAILPFIAAGLVYQQLPDMSVPTHGNIKFEVDGWGSKWQIFDGPIGSLLVAIIWSIALPIVERNLKRRGEEAKDTLLSFALGGTAIELAIAIISGLVIYQTWSSAHQHTALNIDTQRLLFLAMGLIFIVLGNIMPKAKPNGVTGLRVPGAYVSRESWRHCQRAGGYAILAIGLLAVVVAITTSGTRLLTIWGSGAAAAIIVLLLYSVYAGRKYAGLGGPVKDGRGHFIEE